MQPMYRYRALVTGVYDGDSITVDLDLGFYIWMRSQKLRLLGIDTPELNSKDAVVRSAGIVARDKLRELVLGKSVVVETVKDDKEKYGRWLANVFIEDHRKDPVEVINVVQWMLDQKLGVPYAGGART